jgi:phage terminase large subunit
MRQKTDSEYADDLTDFLANSRIRGRKNPRIVVDPSAASFKLELVKRGYNVVDADNEVLDGLHRVSQAQALGLLRVHEECSNERRECSIYSWDAKVAEKGEEKPLKTNDHSQDAKRYAVMDLFPEWRLLERVT